MTLKGLRSISPGTTNSLIRYYILKANSCLHLVLFKTGSFRKSINLANVGTKETGLDAYKVTVDVSTLDS